MSEHAGQERGWDDLPVAPISRIFVFEAISGRVNDSKRTPVNSYSTSAQLRESENSRWLACFRNDVVAVQVASNEVTRAYCGGGARRHDCDGKQFSRTRTIG